LDKLFISRGAAHIEMLHFAEYTFNHMKLTVEILNMVWWCTKIYMVTHMVIDRQWRLLEYKTNKDPKFCF